MCYLEVGWKLTSCKRSVSLKILQVIKSAQEIFVKDLLDLKIAKGLFKEDWFFIITEENYGKKNQLLGNLTATIFL